MMRMTPDCTSGGAEDRTRPSSCDGRRPRGGATELVSAMLAAWERALSSPVGMPVCPVAISDWGRTTGRVDGPDGKGVLLLCFDDFEGAERASGR